MAGRLTSALAAIAFLGFGLGTAHADPLPYAQLANAAAAAVTPGAASAMPAKSFGWQCAQFARIFSGIQIFGDAATWWTQAMGKYARGFTPESGSVLVFRPFGPMTRGHVAVVSQVLTDRIIQVTHANWSMMNGHRGQIEKDVTVVDVSAAGDWSQVKVWYDPSRDLGTTVYPTYGFVYKTAAKAFGAAKAATGAFDTAARNAIATRVSDTLR